MPTTKGARRGLLPWRRRPAGGAIASPLQPLKLRAIDFAFRRFDTKSVADLGGVWAVEAGYTFYCLERYAPERAVLVDTGVTATVQAGAARFPALEIIHRNFADPEVAAEVGDVDALLLFDVLLHQVRPDWDEILRTYAPRVKAFVVVQPQWIHTDETVRLHELGRDEFRRSVPDEESAHLLFERLDEIHPKYDRPWRDVHEVWQWGITDDALEATMRTLGFRTLYYEDAGSWQGLDRFGSHAFVFAR